MASMIALQGLVFLIPILLQPGSALLNITLNLSLVANDNSSPWMSPSGDFAFGFHQLKNTDLFLLAIWFDKIPDKTVVWYANGDKPAPQGSKVVITANGLVLTDPDGKLIWESQLTQTGNVSYGAMLDTGNFVLVDSKSTYVWESFKYPKDTILPSQTLGSDTSLVSKLTETNFSRGRFQLFFLDGVFQLSPVAWPSTSRYKSYISVGIANNDSQSVNQLVFNGSSANIYLMKTDGETEILPWQMQEPIVAENYYRATLDYSGVFTKYAHPRGINGEQGWSIVQYLPQDICSVIFDDQVQLGSGSCGYNSYCIMVDGRPTCKCPPEYSLMDGNNLFGGCKPNFPLGCGVDDESVNLEDVYEIKLLQGVNWPFGDYERLAPYSEAECIASCLKDCMCDVAIFGEHCWKKRTPVANGQLANDKTKALIKVRKAATLNNSCPVPTCIKKGKEQYKSILLGSLSASLVVNAILLITLSSILFLFLNRKSKKFNPVSSLLETNLHMFSYKELEEATDNFKEEIGRGSSAIVYKGILKFGSNCVIAVKKLDKLAQEAEKEFRTEMKVIGNTRHKNLVRLLGFCEEGAHRILVYEFMSNGTLANFLFGIPKPAWNIRAKIAMEIARGLVYLHEDCEVPIIHCDIKPENILLDEGCTAKISDFGLAKLLRSNQSRTLTNIRGTRGYVAPEWFRNVAVTAKVDVYSFGVMLLEIICCRKNVSKLEDEEGILTDWVYDCYVEGKIEAVVEFDKEAVADKERIGRWVSIAIWCIQEDPSERLSTKMVLQMLEGCMDVPSPPMPLFISTF